MGDDDDGDDGDDDGRIFSEHPSPILHAPRDNISRHGNALTPIRIIMLCSLNPDFRKINVKLISLMLLPL